MRKHIISLIVLFLFSSTALYAQNATYTEYRGKVVDRSTRAPLTYCNVILEGTNLATITNAEGEFSLKVPLDNRAGYISFRYLGYMNHRLPLSTLIDNQIIEMQSVSYQLPQIDVVKGDATEIVKNMFAKIHENYPQHEMFMTAFYRESIRRNRNYVSLSEAVVDIHKQPRHSFRNDLAKLFKSRQQTDYSRLDTLVFKLMGGPYNNMYLDVIRHPDIVFTENVFENYYFELDKIDWMDERLVYVVKFNHFPARKEALYRGRLYIDAANYALKSAVFSLSLDNKEEAMRMLIRRKPLNARVTPIEANYRMDYVEKNGKWYYAYSRLELGMRINWHRKLFNTNYFATIEMAVTDHENSSDNRAISFRERLRSNVIISDAANGFTDPDFWGPFNIIEPEKPIEAAIRKIQRNIER